MMIENRYLMNQGPGIKMICIRLLPIVLCSMLVLSTILIHATDAYTNFTVEDNNVEDDTAEVTRRFYIEWHESPDYWNNIADPLGCGNGSQVFVRISLDANSSGSIQLITNKGNVDPTIYWTPILNTTIAPGTNQSWKFTYHGPTAELSEFGPRMDMYARLLEPGDPATGTSYYYTLNWGEQPCPKNYGGSSFEWMTILSVCIVAGFFLRLNRKR